MMWCTLLSSRCILLLESSSMARMSRHVDDERVGIGIENEPMSASAAELKQVSVRGGGESAGAVAVS